MFIPILILFFLPSQGLPENWMPQTLRAGLSSIRGSLLPFSPSPYLTNYGGTVG